eukprot:7387486-Prymnesium_polylepis.1
MKDVVVEHAPGGRAAAVGTAENREHAALRWRIHGRGLGRTLPLTHAAPWGCRVAGTTVPTFTANTNRAS